jgi:FkbH-like protein
MTTMREIKCMVWDLDNTLWNGVLLEDEHVTLRAHAVDIIKSLDERGILHSIASKNEREIALEKVAEFGLADYFLYPQIGWHSKVASIQQIAQLLNIGIDSIAFIDDQPYERDEVLFSLPQVLCFDADDLDQLLARPELNPSILTPEAKTRRQMYFNSLQRDQAEAEFSGPKEAFLASLALELRISQATEEQLMRCAELTRRTNQLNTTGYTYSLEELRDFMQSPAHILLSASLQDKYGTYGQIGLVLLGVTPEVWTIKLLLMSCRVMSRGVGAVMINQIRQLAKARGVRLQAEFVGTDRNRMMLVTYKFARFDHLREENGVQILLNDLNLIPPTPDYITVHVEL